MSLNTGVVKSPRFDLSILNIAETGYLAGIIDGEGTITIKWTGDHYSPWIAIGTTSQSLAEWMGRVFSRRVYEPSKQYSWHKKSYLLVISSLVEVKTVLEFVLPFLVIKRLQAIVCLMFCDNHLIGCRENDEELVGLINTFNRRGEGPLSKATLPAFIEAEKLGLEEGIALCAPDGQVIQHFRKVA